MNKKNHPWRWLKWVKPLETAVNTMDLCFALGHSTTIWNSQKFQLHTFLWHENEMPLSDYRHDISIGIGRYHEFNSNVSSNITTEWNISFTFALELC